MSGIKFSNSVVSSAVQTPTKASTEGKTTLLYKPDYNHRNFTNIVNNKNICNTYSINSIFNSIIFKKNTPKFLKLDPYILERHREEKIYNYKLKYTSQKPKLEEYRIQFPKVLQKTNTFLDISTPNNSKLNKSKDNENKSFFEEATKKISSLKRRINRNKNSVYKNDYFSFIIHSNKNLVEDENKVQQVTNYKESENLYTELSENDIYQLRKSFDKYKNRVINSTEKNLKRRNRAVVLPNLFLSADKKKFEKISLNSIKRRKEKEKEKIKIEINEQ